MYYIIAVFRTRSETLFFANLLKNNGIFASVVNTPRQAGQACGICVKFLPDSLSRAQELLLYKCFQGFAGLYSVVIRNGMMSEFKRI